MKKKLFGFCAAICFLLSMACPAFASSAILPFNEADIPFDTMVTDNADLLTNAQEEELSAKSMGPDPGIQLRCLYRHPPLAGRHGSMGSKRVSFGNV